MWRAFVPFWLSTLGRVPAGAHVPDARARFARKGRRFDVLSVSDDGTSRERRDNVRGVILSAA